MSFPPHMPMMPPMPFFPPMMIPPPNLSTPPPGMPITNSTQKPGDNEKKSRSQGVTTVFVGSISDRAPDVMIKRMLQLCGDVINWKRIQGADGKLQAFGFCEYENPDGTLRCIRLLNGYQIQDKKLLVKVDSKTKTIIDEYKKKKRRELAKKAAKDMTAFKVLYEEDDDEKTDANSIGADGKKKSGEEGEIEEEDDDYIDNDTRREDSAVKQAIETVMREYAREMNFKALEAKEQAMREAQMAAAAPSSLPLPPLPPSASTSSSSSVPVVATESPTSDDQSIPPGTQRVDPAVALENEEEKRSLITNEIQLFRHRFKDEETKMRNTEKERRDRYERERAVQREKRAAEESAKSPSSPNDDRHRSSSSRHHTSNSIRSLTSDRHAPSSSSSSSRYDRRSPRPYHRRSRTKSPISKSHRNDDDDEETLERKRQERRIREKENIYRDRLKTWEQRERKKRSDYQAEKERELLRLHDEEKERKRSLTFHASYNDDTHDYIYYKGTSLARRIKDREREIDLDKRDRQREKEEIHDLKKKLISEDKYDDIELEIKHRLQKEEETIRKRLADLVRATSDISSEESDDEQETKKKLSPSIKKEITDQKKVKEQSPETTIKNEPSQEYLENSPPPTSALGGAPITGTKIVSKRRLARNEAFGDDQEDENTTTLPKKSKLSAIPDRQSPIAQPIPVVVKEEEPPAPKVPDANSLRVQEEKRQAVCKLIESIPTKKEDLFTFPLDWSLLDSIIMEKRIKPWVTKKIVEYLGEEEPTLTDFICSSIMSKKSAESILNDIKVVLDNEADVFVVKMWRLIVYEIEAKRNGLSK